MTHMIIWFVVIMVATAAVLGFKIFARRSFGQARDPRPLSELYEQVKDEVSAEAFNEVWSKIGEVFSIDPRVLRPTDTLKSLSKIDSWELGEGEDALSSWLVTKQLGKPPVLRTILDLARWVDGTRELTERLKGPG